MWIWIWVAVVAASLIIEFVTMDLVSVWFVLGGVVALILASLKVSFEIQIVTFIIISILFLVVLRKPLLKKIVKPTQKTNVDALIGNTCELITDITFNNPGTIKINGIVWNAVTEDNSEVAKGTIVEVVSIKGNKVIVTKSKKENK